MKRWISLLALLVLSVTTATLIAEPAYARWFRYPGISCGPDQHAVISTYATGSGYVNGQYAYSVGGPGGGVRFAGFRVGTGSHSIVVPSRSLDSYDVVAGGGARLVSHGTSCR